MLLQKLPTGLQQCQTQHRSK